MSDKGSKDNVNEDNTPLMEGEEKTGETPEKEEVEMEEKKEEEKEYRTHSTLWCSSFPLVAWWC